MIQIAICDNDSKDLESVVSAVDGWIQEKAQDSEYTSFSSAYQLLTKLNEGAYFDIYVLDIVMPKIDGIELGRKIREQTREASIIYTTSETSYALEAFGIHALRYIVKPIKKEDLFSALDMALMLYEAKPKYMIQLNNGNEIRNVNLDDVMYIENDVRTIYCTMRDGQRIPGNHYDSTFETAVGAAEEMDSFIRVHKSFYINMKYVSSFQSNAFLMDDGAEIYIASRRLAKARTQYLKYVSGNGGIS